MSLVGPRPPLPDEVAGYDLWHRRRLSMKPGITGLWQVRGRRDPDFDRWVEADLEYIDRWSLWLDVKILLADDPGRAGGTMTREEGPDHRHHRPGRLVPRRAAARKGYEVHGLIRRSSSFTPAGSTTSTTTRTRPATRLFLHYADLTDSSSLIGHLHRIKPDEVYNLGAQSHVKVSFEMPEFTADTAGMGTLRMLEAVRTADWPIRFYQAGSSRDVRQGASRRPQTETTPFHPRSPYAIAKVFAHWMTVQYREAYGLHASNGILFNHESPRRGGTFVTRKVTRGDRGDPRRAGRARCTSATSTPGATGATPRSTSRRCG